jgi:hypothetical protein
MTGSTGLSMRYRFSTVLSQPRRSDNSRRDRPISPPTVRGGRWAGWRGPRDRITFRALALSSVPPFPVRGPQGRRFEPWEAALDRGIQPHRGDIRPSEPDETDVVPLGLYSHGCFRDNSCATIRFPQGSTVLEAAESGAGGNLRPLPCLNFCEEIVRTQDRNAGKGFSVSRFLSPVTIWLAWPSTASSSASGVSSRFRALRPISPMPGAAGRRTVVLSSPNHRRTAPCPNCPESPRENSFRFC